MRAVMCTVLRAAALISLALVLVSAAAFYLFWRTEKRASQPMVETVHLRQRSTWAPLLTTTLTMTGIFAVINGIVPAYVQAADPGFGRHPAASRHDGARRRRERHLHGLDPDDDRRRER